MILADPRLGDLLQHHILKILVSLLKHKEHPKLQSHAAIILQYVVACSGNREVVMKLITPSIIVNLMHSAVCEVQKQHLKYESSHVLAFACSGILYLCDGKQNKELKSTNLELSLIVLLSLLTNVLITCQDHCWTKSTAKYREMGL